MIIRIEAYKENELIFKKINLLISNKISNCLLCAVIHGSVASNEIIPYSDFDAMAIIKNDVYDVPHLLNKTLKTLKRIEQYMFKFDPLQHHGWFVLKEADLENYPEHFLPIEVLIKSKAIYPVTGIELKVNPVFSKIKMYDNFLILANGLIHKLSLVNKSWNLYQLKSIFSQFMLLPALYIQVKDGKGIDKKRSFDLARLDFSESRWAVMDEVSTIRKEWRYSINPLQKFLLTRTGRLRTIFARYMPIAIPMEIKSKMTPNFIFCMKELVVEMQNKLKSCYY